MKKTLAFAFSFCLLITGFLCLAQAQLPMTGAGKGAPGGGGGGGCTEATTFLARTSGLDGTHTTAYTNLICGLVTDGIWTSFDILYIYATQDATTAQLNLPNSTYTPTFPPPVGYTFTADSGYTGDGTASVQIYTGFNPVTAGSPKFVQDSAHVSAWNLTTTGGAALTVVQNGSGINIYPDFGGSAYLRVNDVAGGLTIADPRGHLLGNRDSSTGRQGYQNGASLGSYGSVSSSAVDNTEIGVLATSTLSCAMVSAGQSLSSGQVSNFYSRLRTYMTAVGVP